MSNSIENQNNFDERTHLGTQNCVWLQQSETIIYVFKFIKSIKKVSILVSDSWYRCRYRYLWISFQPYQLLTVECWPSCSTFPPISWTCFNQEFRTNNDLEGTSNNRRLNALAKDMGLVLQYCMGFNQNNTWRGPEITTYCGVIIRGLSAEKKMGRTGGENTFLVGPIHC